MTLTQPEAIGVLFHYFRMHLKICKIFKHVYSNVICDKSPLQSQNISQNNKYMAKMKMHM